MKKKIDIWYLKGCIAEVVEEDGRTSWKMEGFYRKKKAKEVGHFEQQSVTVSGLHAQKLNS